MTNYARRLVTGPAAALALLLAMSLAVRAGEAEWLAHMKTAAAAYQRGDYHGALTSLTAALKEAEAFGDTDQRLAITLNNLASLYRAQGQYAQAEPLLKRSLAILERALGPEHLGVGAGFEQNRVFEARCTIHRGANIHRGKRTAPRLSHQRIISLGTRSPRPRSFKAIEWGLYDVD